MMKLFNRIFTITGLAVLLLLGAAALLAPAAMLSLMHTTADALRTRAFTGMTDFTRVAVRILAALIWIFFFAGVLWLELRKPRSIMLSISRKDSGAIIQITTNTVEARLSDAVDGLAGIIAARATARPRNKAVEISIDVRATRETDPVAKAAEIGDLVRNILQNDLGLRLYSDPQIFVRTVSGKAKVDRNKPRSLFARLRQPEPTPEHETAATEPEASPASSENAS